MTINVKLNIIKITEAPSGFDYESVFDSEDCKTAVTSMLYARIEKRFKRPISKKLAQEYVWQLHKAAKQDGSIGFWDVLIPRLDWE